MSVDVPWLFPQSFGSDLGRRRALTRPGDIQRSTAIYRQRKGIVGLLAFPKHCDTGAVGGTTKPLVTAVAFA